MNYGKLKTELMDGMLKNLYLLYGDEDFLKKALEEKIYSMSCANEEAQPEKVRFGDEITPEDLSQAVNTVSFFGRGKFIKCVNTGIFKGKSKSEDYERIFGNIPEGTCIVFLEEDVDKKNPLFSEMNKAGYAYSVEMRKNGELSKYIAGRFKREGKKISHENISLFLEYSGGSLTDIEADIEKILLFMEDRGEVRREYIDKLCSGTRQYRIYEMLDSIFYRQKDKSITLMKELLSDKVPVQVLLVSIHSRLMELLAVKEDMEKGRDPQITRRGRPVAGFIIGFLKRQAGNYTLGALKEGIKDAADTDVKIKTGEIDDVTGLEILVNSLIEV